MRAKGLHVSATLTLPVDAVTSTLVVYGGKGMGKTNFASVLVEEFATAGLRFAVIDPMGVWWGLRHDATGKGPGVEANGSLPRGSVVHHKDRNSENDALDNLQAMTRAAHAEEHRSEMNAAQWGVA
jgi:hypothetical protein